MFLGGIINNFLSYLAKLSLIFYYFRLGMSNNLDRKQRVRARKENKTDVVFCSYTDSIQKKPNI